MTRSHWDERFGTTTELDRSWTQPEPTDSLRFLELAGVAPGDAVLDVGGGASHLVDALVARGFGDVTVLDISEVALAEARARLGSTPGVRWVAADVTAWAPERTFRLWHDRAVFHFLVDDEDRAAYQRCATAAVEPGGHLVVATFAPHGPEQCSGLPVRRWAADELADAFAHAFDPVTAQTLDHHTPWGSTQPFTWVLLRRRDTPEPAPR